MAYTALFCSEQRMKQWTALDVNTRTEEITPWLISAQDIYIQDVLGTTFYNHLKSAIIGSTLTPDEETLLNEYVAPTLMHYALYLMLPSIKYKIVEKGLLSGTSEETAPTTLDELQYMRKAEQDLAQFYMERLREFLRNNPGMFPQYEAPNPLDGMLPNHQKPYFSGLVTSGIRKYKTWYEDYCDDCNPDHGPSVP